MSLNILRQTRTRCAIDVVPSLTKLWCSYKYEALRTCCAMPYGKLRIVANKTGNIFRKNEKLDLHANGKAYSNSEEFRYDQDMVISPKICINPEGWKTDFDTIKTKDNIPLFFLILGRSHNSNVILDIFPRYPLAMLLEKVRQELNTANVSLCTKNIKFLGERNAKFVRWAESTEISSIISSIIASIPGNVELHLKVENSEYNIELPESEEIRSSIKVHLDEVQAKLAPLKKIDKSITNKAYIYSKTIIWAGFLYLVIQTLVMARLTWWEYSWDVTEPIAYFLTTSLGIAGIDTWSQIIKRNKIKNLRNKYSFPHYKYDKLQSQEAVLKSKLYIIDSLIEKSLAEKEPDQEHTTSIP